MSIKVPITIVHGEVIMSTPITTRKIKSHDGKTLQLTDEEIKTIATSYKINQKLKTTTQPTTHRKRTIPPSAKCIVCARNNVSLSFVPKNYVKHHDVAIPANVEEIWSCFRCSH